MRLGCGASFGVFLFSDFMTIEEAIAEASENQAQNQTIEPCVTRRLLHGIDTLADENVNLRLALGRAKARLKLEGYKATSRGIREIDELLRKPVSYLPNSKDQPRDL